MPYKLCNDCSQPAQMVDNWQVWQCLYCKKADPYFSGKTKKTPTNLSNNKKSKSSHV